MFLTIKELAGAANVSQGLLRQHIQRGHLRVHREGGKVSVAVEDARRWARQRGFALSLSTVLPETHGDAVSRSARVAVLAWHPHGGDAVNLFTHVRHRRQASLGPWARPPDENWSSMDLTVDSTDRSGEVKLHVVDLSFGSLEELLEDVFTGGELQVEQTKIGFKLHAVPRHYRAFREERDGSHTKVVSPFSRHSAELIELWCFEDEPQAKWLELVEARPPGLQPLLARLGFRLDRLSDRVGNLMIAGALDGIDCELHAPRNGKMVLSVDGEEFRPNEYSAAVWASHSDDEVFRLTFPLVRNETVVNRGAEIDRLGFAVYRNRDGACMDLLDERLIMEISMKMTVDAGPSLRVLDGSNSTIAELSPFSSHTLSTFDAQDESSDLDHSIRRAVLDRKARVRDAAARSERGLARFGPEEFDDAVDYFLGLLAEAAFGSGPTYIADPYFTKRGPTADEHRLYLGMFNATAGKPLRILCGEGRTDAWWGGYPSILSDHATARMFQKPWDKSAFHDRYLVTPGREIQISNSFNNWKNAGVTFVELAYGVYGAEAESLWAMRTGTSDKSIHVYEVQ